MSLLGNVLQELDFQVKPVKLMFPRPLLRRIHFEKDPLKFYETGTWSLILLSKKELKDLEFWDPFSAF